MKIGMIGLGKLGLPVAVTMAMKGHDVLGFDKNPARMTRSRQEYQEAGPDGTGSFNHWLARSSIRFGSLKDIMTHAEIVFVAVQTPHDPMYEGVTRLPNERIDFDYSYLRDAMRAITKETQRSVIVAIISTVLPGTIEHHIMPIVEHNPNIKIVYTASFIAMGTCVKPDEIIAGDYEPIESLRIGTECFGVSGLGHVTATFRRPYNGKLVHIKANGCLPIEVTPDHPLFIASRTDWYNKPLSAPRWISAKDIVAADAHASKRNDYLIIPRLKPSCNDRVLSLADYASKHGISRATGRGCAIEYTLDADTAWLLGLFVAEGSARINKKPSRCGLAFSLHKRETDLAERVMRTLTKLGYKSNISSNGNNSINVRSGSSILSRAFSHWCGHGANKKQIPEFLLMHKDLSLLESFLHGYMQGDGYISVRRGVRRYTAVTVSRKLAMQLQLAYARLGIFAYIAVRRQEGTQIICGRIVKARTCYTIRYEDSARKAQVEDNWIATRVKSVKHIPYKGDVCNIETTDNTYLVSNAIVHNCMRDFLNHEFYLVGTDDSNVAEIMQAFYATISPTPVRCMSIASAELTKVAYNTFISLKIAFANTVMEICDKFQDADCDDVMDSLKTATIRLISPAYLTGGMGDGGGCHPRDNIAMSWLAREHNLSFDLFEAAMLCREKQTQWLAQMLRNEHKKTGLPIVILGRAFKPETNLIDGSPAILIGNMLKDWNVEVTYVDDSVRTVITERTAIATPSIFLIGCRHERYRNADFATGSVIIDPHRYISRSASGEYEVYRLGEGRKK